MNTPLNVINENKINNELCQISCDQVKFGAEPDSDNTAVFGDIPLTAVVVTNLDGYATLQDIPENVSQLENDSGYIVSSFTDERYVLKEKVRNIGADLYAGKITFNQFAE